MKIDLSFWRFVIIISIAKSFFWGKGDETYFIHIGTFSNDKNTALKVVILSFSIFVGLIDK